MNESFKPNWRVVPEDSTESLRGTAEGLARMCVLLPLPLKPIPEQDPDPEHREGDDAEG